MRQISPDQIREMRSRLLKLAAPVCTVVLAYYLAATRPIDTSWVFPLVIVAFLALGSAIRPPQSR